MLERFGTGMSRRRGRVAAVAIVCAGTVTGGAVTMPEAHATADWFNGVQSPVITTSTAAHQIVHMGVLGYGQTEAIGLDTGTASPRSIPRQAESQLVKSPRLSYAVNRYIDSAGRYMPAAVSWYLRKYRDSHASDVGKAMTAIKNKDHAHYLRVLKDYKWINSTAQKWAGPYTMSPRVHLDGTSGGTVDRIGLKTRSDRWYAHKSVTVTLHGPAQFPGGSATKSGKTKHHGLSWSWTRTGQGKVSATVKVSGLPPLTYRVYHTDDRQRLAVPGPMTSLSSTVRQPVPMNPHTSPPSTPSPSSPAPSPSSPPSSAPSPTSPPSSPPSSAPSPSAPAESGAPPAPTAPASGASSTAAPVSWHATTRRSAQSTAGMVAVALNRSTGSL